MESDDIRQSYPSDLRDRAYEHWRQSGSMRDTARALNLPDGTVRSWSRQDGWTLRRIADDGRDRDVIHAHAQLRLTSEVDSLIEEAIAIARTATDRDGNPDNRTRLAAIKMLLDLDGMGRQDASQTRQDGLGASIGLPRTLSDTDRANVVLRLLGSS